MTVVLVLRHRERDAPRPYKAWGYPTAPLVFVAASLMMVANAIWRSPATSLTGLAIIAPGVPIYVLAWRQSTVQDS